MAGMKRDAEHYSRQASLSDYIIYPYSDWWVSLTQYLNTSFLIKNVILHELKPKLVCIGVVLAHLYP